MEVVFQSRNRCRHLLEATKRDTRAWRSTKDGRAPCRRDTASQDGPPFVFDFDKTLADTKCQTFEDYTEPDFIDKAEALPLTFFAAQISKRNLPIKVLTARTLKYGVGEAIQRWLQRHGINCGEVVGANDLFDGVRVKGKRKPRKLRTSEKKALVLAHWSAHSKVCFWDDDRRNIQAVEDNPDVIATKVQ